MRRLRLSIVITWALLLTVVAASAQNRANFPWWNSPIVEDLGLTAAQKQKIHQIVRAYRDRLFDARNAHQKAQAELDDMLNDPDVNLETIKPVVDKVATTQANASRLFLEMSVQIRGVLTLDQWRILVRRWDEFQKKRPSETQTPP
jgi:Spy/CpxP family protein refolding chaperone